MNHPLRIVFKTPAFLFVAQKKPGSKLPTNQPTNPTHFWKPFGENRLPRDEVHLIFSDPNVGVKIPPCPKNTYHTVFHLWNLLGFRVSYMENTNSYRVSYGFHV